MNYIKSHKKIILLACAFLLVMILSFVFITSNFRKKEKDKGKEITNKIAKEKQEEVFSKVGLGRY